ncbi:hypothetical protein ACVBEH_05160 [Roseateles sp. GG27B]
MDECNVAISRQLMAIRVIGASPRFVHTVLSSAFEHFQALSTGAAILGISRDQVLGLKIALPPIDRQHRIVAILDEAFEGIATATAKAKAKAEKNLLNARELFESQRDGLLSARPDWHDAKLSELCDVKHGYAF